MLKEEFLKLTGLESIDEEKYHSIETAYEELNGIDKDEFCYLYMNDKDALIGKLGKQCSKLEDGLAQSVHTASDIAEATIMSDFTGTKAYRLAYGILGEREAITFKIKNGIALTADDEQYIFDNLR